MLLKTFLQLNCPLNSSFPAFASLCVQIEIIGNFVRTGISTQFCPLITRKLLLNSYHLYHLNVQAATRLDINRFIMKACSGEPILGLEHGLYFLFLLSLIPGNMISNLRYFAKHRTCLHNPHILFKFIRIKGFLVEGASPCGTLLSLNTRFDGHTSYLCEGDKKGRVQQCTITTCSNHVASKQFCEDT